MNKKRLLATLFLLSSTGAYAGGMDRSGLSVSALFEAGSYVELNAATVDPDVSGSLGNSLFSSDIAPRYFQFSGAYKQDLSDRFSMVVIIDQPYGAHIEYPTGTNYPLAGANASMHTLAITGAIRYKFTPSLSAYGGIRNMTSKGDVALPTLTYSMKTDTQNDWGYLLGMAYEKADIGLLTSLTYHSPIDIHFNNEELFSANSLSANSELKITMPQSINFDFQTGITQHTLLMFSARWAEWEKTTITPQLYTTSVSPGNNLVDSKSNTLSYTLGIGRRLTNKLSGSLSLGYEKPSNSISGNLSPTDGRSSFLVGLEYNISPKTAVAAGINYSWIGDSYTSLSGNETVFEGNKAIGFGIKVSHTL